MRLATVLTPVSDENLQLAAQCGVTDLVYRYYGPDVAALHAMQRRAESFGLTISVIEGYLPIEKMKLGIDDGTEMNAMRTLIKQLSDSGINLLCYNFMSGSDWARTKVDAPERGRSKTTAFDLAEVERVMKLGYEAPDKHVDEIAKGLTPEKLWENLARLLDGLLPTAEACGVTMCMHPDDPPLPTLLGKPRIMHNVEGFEQLVSMRPSPSNKICFCQGSFASMGIDVLAAIERLGPHIKYVHFRDVRGGPTRFAETFHDNGPTDMAAAIRAYRRVGYDGPLRPDHVPQLVGEDDGEPGYTMLGRLFAYGYIRGLLHATEPLHVTVQQ